MRGAASGGGGGGRRRQRRRSGRAAERRGSGARRPAQAAAGARCNKQLATQTPARCACAAARGLPGLVVLAPRLRLSGAGRLRHRCTGNAAARGSLGPQGSHSAFGARPSLGARSVTHSGSGLKRFGVPSECPPKQLQRLVEARVWEARGLEKSVITVQGSPTEGGCGVQRGGRGVSEGSPGRGQPGWVLKGEWERAGSGWGRAGGGQRPCRQKEQRVQRHGSVKAPTTLCLVLLQRKI